jgi:hypothetical protein
VIRNLGEKLVCEGRWGLLLGRVKAGLEQAAKSHKKAEVERGKYIHIHIYIYIYIIYIYIYIYMYIYIYIYVYKQVSDNRRYPQQVMSMNECKNICLVMSFKRSHSGTRMFVLCYLSPTLFFCQLL